MTDHHAEIFARMSDREQRAVMSLSPELQEKAIDIWQSTQREKRGVPAGYVPWDQRPASRACLDPNQEREREPGEDDE